MSGLTPATVLRSCRYWQMFADCTHGNGTALVAPGTAAAAAGSTVYSMNCYSHSTSLSDHGMSGMTVGGWRMMDALASFIGLSKKALPAGGLFDPAKGFASGTGQDENHHFGLHVVRAESVCFGSTSELGLF